jgi:hypothetical protein
MKLLCFLIYALKGTTPRQFKLTKNERIVIAMKKLTLIICVVSLLIPTIAMANQPCPLCLAMMLEEGTFSEEELQSIISGDWNEEDVRTLIAESEEINPSDYGNYLCYYFAYSAVMDFLDCLIYNNASDCRAALVYALVFYYYCT